MRAALRDFVERQLHRVGYDVIRFPSSRLRSGQTALVLDRMGIDVVLDVGANIGQYGQFIRSIGFGGPIVSFEPVSVVADQLAERATRDGNWRVERYALGAQDGEATMNITRASVMSSVRTPSSSSPTGIGADIEVVRQELVPIRRLDAVFHELIPQGANVFIKLAAQGLDLEVLAGATGCLPSIVAIQSTVSVTPLYEGMPDWVQSARCLQDLGFVPTGMFPCLHVGDLHVAEFDLMMVRPLD
jgi:FkbM family methyltransferase